MKRIWALIVLTWMAVFYAGTAYGEEQEQPPIRLPLMVECGSNEQIQALIRKHGELPFFSGNTLYQTPGGAFVGRLEVWANPKTRSFTITIRPSDDKTCIVLPGKDLTPYMDEGLTL
tara:strand:+ start:695 stop:1045 length:351 start_codon:yes stop_codon:yes gene_type:complete